MGDPEKQICLFAAACARNALKGEARKGERLINKCEGENRRGKRIINQCVKAGEREEPYLEEKDEGGRQPNHT